jgi:transcriptional regulator with XRE-family HTH domain
MGTPYLYIGAMTQEARRHKTFPWGDSVAIDRAKLRYWRDYYLFSRDELAKDIGVSMPTVRAWELGERYPSQDNFRKLLTALGISPGDLLLDPDRYREPKPEEAEDDS